MEDLARVGSVLANETLRKYEIDIVKTSDSPSRRGLKCNHAI